MGCVSVCAFVNVCVCVCVGMKGVSIFSKCFESSTWWLGSARLWAQEGVISALLRGVTYNPNGSQPKLCCPRAGDELAAGTSGRATGPRRLLPWGRVPLGAQGKTDRPLKGFIKMDGKAAPFPPLR